MILGDYVKITTGKLNANAQEENGIYPFFTCARAISRINSYAFDGEYVLVAGNGELNVKHYSGQFNAYQRTYVLKTNDSSILSNKFLYYFLDNHLEILRKNAIGGVIKYIKLEHLTKIIIDIPTLEEQNRIVTILDKIEAIAYKRRNNISKLSTLIKSLFYRKFDTYIRNVRGYTDFKNVIPEIDTGWSPVCHNYARLTNDKVAVLKQSAISKRFFDSSENKELPSDKEIKKQCFVAKDDLLFSRKNTLDFVGASAYIFDEVENLLMPDTVFNLRYSKKKLSGIYLYYLFNDINYRKNIRELATGALVSMSNISKQKLFELKLPVPDLELQLQFEKETRLVYEKLNIQYKSLDNIELLLKSLTQRIFSGQSQIDIDTELEAIINTINLELPDEENSIDDLIKDMAYRQKLIDKLSTQRFTDIHQYDKAKYIAFRLLKENEDKLSQELDSTRKKIILT